MVRIKLPRRPVRLRRTPRIRRQTAPGTSPGTILAPPDAPPPRITVMKYNARVFEERRLERVGQLKGFVDDEHVTWVNVDGLGNAQVIETLGEVFALHRLALEDTVNVHQRPKIEEYDDHLFMVIRMVTLGESLESEQVSLFLGQNFVLTLQERAGDCLEPVRERLRKAFGKIRRRGADYLTYAIIDSIVDSYFPVVDNYGERLETMDEKITEMQNGRRIVNLFGPLHDVRRDLLLLRRTIRPLRDALSRLQPERSEMVSSETYFYFRDCHDHSVQLIDLIETYREICLDLRDYQLSSINNRMNEVMKVLTVIATLFIPLSFITGLYGMNFDTSQTGNMPELALPYAYPAVLLVMLSVAGALISFFWRKGWIGGGAQHDIFGRDAARSVESAGEGDGAETG